MMHCSFYRDLNFILLLNVLY